MSNAPWNSPWPLPITCNILLQSANIWKRPPAPLLISSCLILAPWRTLKFVFHYSLFNTHYCWVVDTLLPVTLQAYRAIERLLCIFPIISKPLSCFPPPSPSSLPLLPWPSYSSCLSLPHLVTTNLYTIITARCIYLSLYLTCQQLVEWLRDLQAWKVS